MEFKSLDTKSLSVFSEVSLGTYQIFPVGAKIKQVAEVYPDFQNTKSAKKKVDNYNIK